MKATEQLPHIEEVLQIYTDATERLQALEPGNAEPSATDTSEDEEDGDN